jgi:hypothetical protein
VGPWAGRGLGQLSGIAIELARMPDAVERGILYLADPLLRQLEPCPNLFQGHLLVTMKAVVECQDYLLPRLQGLEHLVEVSFEEFAFRGRYWIVARVLVEFDELRFLLAVLPLNQVVQAERRKFVEVILESVPCD